MPEDLPAALAEVRALIARGADPASTLVRAVAAGRRRGAHPAASRVELRLDSIDPDALSPREALDLLYQLKSLAAET